MNALRVVVALPFPTAPLRPAAGRLLLTLRLVVDAGFGLLLPGFELLFDLFVCDADLLLAISSSDSKLDALPAK
jgi:hypothetical protein